MRTFILTITQLVVSVPLLFGLGCSDPGTPQQASQPVQVEQPGKGSVEHIRQVTLAVDDEALRNADANQGDWLTYGRNYKEDRYSELDQIGKHNLNQLGLAWTIELGSRRGLQATPLVVDGIMFFSGTWSVVYAVDARKGEIIWKYDPQVPRETAAKLCCGVVNRGVALYKGSVFVGTLDGRLVSIDAATGSLNWEVKTVPDNTFYTITGAPRVANGKVLIGNGGAELKNIRGYVTAYDAETGEQTWRFYTVPGNPAEPFEHPDLEQAAKTWTGEWWTKGGGGTAWDSIVYDPELNLVYIGVGNGSPWNRLERSPEGGDNLYLSSIVAVKADTGEYVWHYQTTPGDTWDYTATQPMILADLEIEGKPRNVLMQAPKNGFFYVLDRVTGEFISAEAYTYVNWAKGIDSNGRPIEVAGARYEDGRMHWISPSSHGGHNWFPMSYNRKTGMAYLPGVEKSGAYVHDINKAPGDRYAGSSPRKLYYDVVYDQHPDAHKPGAVDGRLFAYDPLKQQVVWEVPQKFFYNGGLLSTANGLLFQGDAEGKFSIRDVDDGRVLWQYDVLTGVIGSPITYMVDGEQYVSLLVEWGGGQGQYRKVVDRLYTGKLYTFKLGGNAPAPERLPPIEKPLLTLTTDASPLEIGRGYNVYMYNCAGCHNPLGGGGGAIPDLVRINEGMFAILDKIVLEGALASVGMPNFGDWLNGAQVEDLKSFLLYAAEAFRTGMPAGEYRAQLSKMQELADTPQGK